MWLSETVTNKDFHSIQPLLRELFERGENVMEAAAKILGEDANRSELIDFAYDLQAGSYTALAIQNPQVVEERAKLREDVIRPILSSGYFSDRPVVCEAGSGESTTLVALAHKIRDLRPSFLGFDISYSRVHVGRRWGEENLETTELPQLAVADIGTIPLQDNSVDLVYTNSALEPNLGREDELISELVRVSRKWIVLFEPIYELANPEMQAWMSRHKYVRDLASTTSKYADVLDYGLLAEAHLISRPRGFIVAKKIKAENESLPAPTASWVCPISKHQLTEVAGALVNKTLGVAYPVVDGIPILKKQFTIFAKALT